MLSIQSFVFNPFSENTWILWDETHSCVIVDPGCMDKNERKELEDFIANKNLKPELLLNTHCHIDHIFGNAWVKKKWNIPLLAHEKDMFNLHGSAQYAQMVGLPFDPSPEPDEFIEEGKSIRFGNTILEVLFTPGHAPGHVCFFHRESKNIISGDVLFQGSIGRCDLPGGNYEVLMQSITQKLFPLGDEVVVHSGHGENTTIGRERKSNPFVLEYMQYGIKGI